MRAFNEFKIETAGEDVGNDIDVVTSYALADSELAFTCLESDQLGIHDIAVTGISGIVCVFIAGSFSTYLSLGG